MGNTRRGTKTMQNRYKGCKGNAKGDLGDIKGMQGDVEDARYVKEDAEGAKGMQKDEMQGVQSQYRGYAGVQRQCKKRRCKGCKVSTKDMHGCKGNAKRGDARGAK
ncbi:unnamed protein product, partial [Owenia fusiformis]